MKCTAYEWREGAYEEVCSREAESGYRLCPEHLEEAEKELDQLAAMGILGVDNYGSI